MKDDSKTPLMAGGHAELTQQKVANGSGPVCKPHSKRKRARSWLRRVKDVCLKHTWVLPLALLAILLAAYAVNPTESNPIHYGIFLSYPLPPETPGGPVLYGKGKLDIAFVAFYTIALSFTREFLMQCVIRPWALYAGIKGRSKITRFMEQVYTAMYFSVFGPYGLYVMKQTNIWYFNTTAMFENFPHKSHTADFKAYYLLEAAYWAQQGIVLLLKLEKPRRDFKELVGHHIITLALIALSYRFHFTYIGLAVYITHDISDFFLATSKTLNYLDSPIITPFFALFVAVWVYMRHYLNLHILWAVLTEFRTVGPFELNWETEQYKFWVSQYITFGLLGSLQAINLFWLYLIIRIAKTYVFGNALQDERSDNEEEDDEIEESSTTGEANGVPIPTLLVNGHATKENLDPIENGSSTGLLTNGNSNGAATKRK
ncbi:TPA_exp: Uncharacterized protein A8136_5152 [Trichophyton benhamiae CBS 112371]|nr:TPA_exp: Uncharacterized protein A8136_5152 [Trichophyton benhamiae CBS 112371]